MELIGKTLVTSTGRQLRCAALLDRGGQGEVYTARDMRTGEEMVVKLFFEEFSTAETLQRLQFLISRDLRSVCPVLFAPDSSLKFNRRIGHATHFAQGQKLSDILDPSAKPLSFPEALQLAWAFAHAVSCLHALSMAHGDLHSSNLLVHRTDAGGLAEIALIDFDNFSAPETPAPRMLGHELYMAPEIRSAATHGRHRPPDIRTDVFSLGVIMHEILLLRHLASGARNSEEFLQALSRWGDDPARPGSAGLPASGGYPATVLNPTISSLFRRSIVRTPEERPLAPEWVEGLRRSAGDLNTCEHCGSTSLIDGGRLACPICGMAWPTVRLIIESSGRDIRIDRASLTLGRPDVGGSPKVSSRHCVVRRRGPEVTLESIGRNGTWREVDSRWIRLPDNKPILLQVGDRLRLADCVVRVDLAA